MTSHRIKAKTQTGRFFMPSKMYGNTRFSVTVTEELPSKSESCSCCAEMQMLPRGQPLLSHMHTPHAHTAECSASGMSSAHVEPADLRPLILVLESLERGPQQWEKDSVCMCACKTAVHFNLNLTPDIHKYCAACCLIRDAYNLKTMYVFCVTVTVFYFPPNQTYN